MSTATAPPAILQRPEGSLTFQVTPDGVRSFARLNKWNAGDLPGRCPLEARPTAWAIGDVIGVSYSVRIARQPKFTFTNWINPGNAAGIRLLTNLARQDHVDLFVVSDEIERQLRFEHVAKRFMVELVQLLKSRPHAWSEDAYAQVQHDVERLYPTSRDLWRASEDARIMELR